MRLTLNGRAVTVSGRPGVSLLELLREQCGLRSMKDGCAPEGSCGACTVIVDGRPVVSCAQPATRFEGRSVLTLEGLNPQSRTAWTDAFLAAGGSQCGFCTPGIVMKAEGLLARNPDPTPQEISRALAGNLCRCTGYAGIVRAIAAEAERRCGTQAPVDGGHTASGLIGERVHRYQGVPQVLGELPFVADMRVPGMLHLALRFSDHPRALVRAIGTDAAVSSPGVVRVITWRDVPGQRHQGLLKADWPLLVAEGEETRYVGDVLAAVVARTRAEARAAAALVEVVYEVRDPVTSTDEALVPDAPRLHPGGNLLSTSVVRRGEVDAALAAAAHVATDTFETQRIEHAFVEPEAALAIPTPSSNGSQPRIHLYSQGQGPGRIAARSPHSSGCRHMPYA